MLQESWSLSDIELLPTGENDKFERKSGKLLQENNFQEKLGKEISAFANSGGGHIILGVTNNGDIDGVPKIFKGKINTQEWLEQIIPTLVEPESLKFRIHLIEIENNSNSVVIVIDVADSIFAPFQERKTKSYYYRAGSHSKPAPHFYLEAIRNRPRLPALMATLRNAKVVHIIKTDQSHFYQVVLFFDVTNNGVVTPPYWHIDIANNDERLTGEGFVIRSNFPVPSLEMESNVHKKIILPSQTIKCVELIGLHIPAFPINTEGLEKAIKTTLNQNKLTASVITNTNICEESELNNYYLGNALFNSQYFESVSALIDDFTGLIGQGVFLRNFSIKEDLSSSSYVPFSGEIENQTDSTLNNLVLSIIFKDKNDQSVHIEKEYFKFLAPKSTQRFSGSIEIEKLTYAVKKEIYAFETYQN